ncbi:fumarate reductase subunit FrdD [Photobacterium sp. 53610]|uniref:fumarate reductase subunit FrdD n=1 Tax=Photobacterium sp. 53610 TaxID=3102789 RepID=UPI003FA6A9AA
MPVNSSDKVNPHPKRSDEPIWWGLFGAGGTWFAMVTPVTILVLGILMPLGILDAEHFEYQRVEAFASSLIGAAFLILTLALPMWHAMHRVHHGLHDLKIHAGRTGKIACYGFAAFITALAIVLIVLL